MLQRKRKVITMFTYTLAHLCSRELEEFTVTFVSSNSNTHPLIVFSIVILSWLVDDEVANQALKGDHLIEEKHVECRPESFDSYC